MCVHKCVRWLRRDFRLKPGKLVSSCWPLYLCIFRCFFLSLLIFASRMLISTSDMHCKHLRACTKQYCSYFDGRDESEINRNTGHFEIRFFFYSRMSMKALINTHAKVVNCACIVNNRMALIILSNTSSESKVSCATVYARIMMSSSLCILNCFSADRR